MTDIPSLKLTSAQQEALLDAGKNIQTLKVHIEQLRRAGLPVANLLDQLNKAEALRLGMLREFGTG